MNNCVKMIMQGDSYFITFKIKAQGEYIDINTVDVIEFMVGNLKKYYGTESAVVTYILLAHVFLFPISQQESLAFEGPQKVQIRVKDTSGNVFGKVYGNIQLQYSESEVIL